MSAVLYRDTKTQKLYARKTELDSLKRAEKIFIFPKPRTAGRGFGGRGGHGGAGFGGRGSGHGGGRGGPAAAAGLSATSPNRSFAYGTRGYATRGYGYRNRGWGRGGYGIRGWGFYGGWYWSSAFLASLIVLSAATGGGSVYYVPWNILLTWPLFMPYYSYYRARYGAYGGVPLSQVQQFAPSNIRTQTPPQ